MLQNWLVFWTEISRLLWLLCPFFALWLILPLPFKSTALRPVFIILYMFFWCLSRGNYRSFALYYIVVRSSLCFECLKLRLWCRLCSMADRWRFALSCHALLALCPFRSLAWALHIRLYGLFFVLLLFPIFKQLSSDSLIFLLEILISFNQFSHLFDITISLLGPNIPYQLFICRL